MNVVNKIRLLEVDAYTNPTLAPVGESPIAENIFKICENLTTFAV